MYVNRNEIFNGALAITNIILDLDIALKEPVPFRRLHEALGHFRRGALAAVQLLFPAARVDPDAYPCYFSKAHVGPARRPWVPAADSATTTTGTGFPATTTPVMRSGRRTRAPWTHPTIPRTTRLPTLTCATKSAPRRNLAKRIRPCVPAPTRSDCGCACPSPPRTSSTVL